MHVCICRSFSVQEILESSVRVLGSARAQVAFLGHQPCKFHMHCFLGSVCDSDRWALPRAPVAKISAHVLPAGLCLLTDPWRKQQLSAKSSGSVPRSGSLHMSARFCFFWPLLVHCVVALCRTLCHLVASQCSAHICNDCKQNSPHLRPMLVSAAR